MFIYGTQNQSDISSPLQLSRIQDISALKHGIELLTSLIQTPVPYTKRCKKHLLTGKSKCPPSGRREFLRRTRSNDSPSFSQVPISEPNDLYLDTRNSQVLPLLGSANRNLTGAIPTFLYGRQKCRWHFFNTGLKKGILDGTLGTSSTYGTGG